MLISRIMCVLVFVLAFGTHSAGFADFIHSAVSVSGPAPIADFVWERTIDQSGLSAGYLSGVTDFETYVGSSPIHVRENTPPNYAAALSDIPVDVEFDLGADLVVTQLAVWNYPFPTSASVIEFDVFTSQVEDFSVSLFAGSFEAIADGDGDINSVQVFDLEDSDARYVRFRINSSANGSAVGLSEIAFGASSIPEPASFAVMAMFFGYSTIRRRR